jgi:hypothetical protein
MCTTRLATVVVDVDDPARRGDRLGHLVGVARGRKPGADVEELADPLRGGQVADGPPEERPVGLRGNRIAGKAAMVSSPATRSAVKLSFPLSQ